MEARLEAVSQDACDEARSLASAALDGHPLDELNRRLLRRHLAGLRRLHPIRAPDRIDCPTAPERAARAVPLPAGRKPGRALAASVVCARQPRVAAVVVVAVGVASLPQAADTPAPLRRMVATVDVPAGAPVKLPIGQRSAASDFAAGYRALEA